MKQRVTLVLFFLAFLSTAQAQQRRSLFLLPDTLIQLDSLSIVPGSFSIREQGKEVESSRYEVDYAAARLRWKDTLAANVDIYYRSFAFRFQQNYFHKDRALIGQRSMNSPDAGLFSLRDDREGNVLSLGAINKSGSISRSITVGNSQDLAVNSNLNLQLNGKITDNVELVAAISDANIPIQPEGNTQQLQDFDRLFIQVRNPENSLTVGDFILTRPNSYFLNFTKKAKGGYYQGRFMDTVGRGFQAEIAAAVAKGKYTRNIFMGQEGNQGPYRLKGDNGEFFLIILSGSERVFIDGQLQTRGQDNDYLIDYNTAEITFTSHRLITQNTRIQVEFEYSDKNYARSLVYTELKYAGKKGGLQAHFYNEQDNKNQPFNQTLDNDQKRFLSTIGDRIGDAFYPNVDTATYSPDQVLYRRTDSLGYTGIYVYSTDPALAKYRVGFTLVGQGKGNYRLKPDNAVNGRVFEWLEPIAGIPQGDYEPVLLLISPKRSQLLTLAGHYQLAKGWRLTNEAALSNKDINLYANNGNADNVGFANKIGMQKENRINLGTKEPFYLSSKISYEFDKKEFSPIERFRAPEFEREFGAPAIDTMNTHLLDFDFGLRKTDRLDVHYQFNSIFRKSTYDGNRNVIAAKLSSGRNTLNYAGSLLRAEGSQNLSKFAKQNASLSRDFRIAVFGISGMYEDYRLRDKAQDTLLRNSFSFREAKVFLKSPEKSKNTYQIDYTKRYDDAPQQQDFKSFTDADILNLDIAFLPKLGQAIRTGGACRRVQTKGIKEDAATVLARLGYDYSFLKGLLNGSSYYEVGTGQEPKRIVSYLKVDNGKGIYTWNDYNGNGIEEINEFVEAAFRDQANYLRIFTQSNQFERSNNTQLSTSVNISPDALFTTPGTWQKLLNRFSTQSSFSTVKKETNTAGGILLNPFFKGLADTGLLSLNATLRNALFFNRLDPVFGADYTIADNASRLLLINGVDSRQRSEHDLRFRWAIVQRLLWVQEFIKGKKEYIPAVVGAQAGYTIDFFKLKPTFTFNWSANLRMSMEYAYQEQQNKTLAKERLRAHSLAYETRYVFPTRGTLSGKLSYINNQFSGALNSAVAYEMMEGLQTGNNLTWNVSLQRNLAENLQMNVAYDGRRSESGPAIHTGSVQVRAFF